MIEEIISPQGERVFCVDGITLGSRIDPRKEARHFVTSYSSSFDHVDSLIVLGALSGFHLDELRKRYPAKRIIVIERHSELQSQIQSHHSLVSPTLEFVIVKGSAPEEILDSDYVRRALRKSYAVVGLHRLAPKAYPGFDAIEAFLLARDHQSFVSICEIRAPWRDALVARAQLRSISDEVHALNMSRSLDVTHSAFRSERVAIKICGELVK